MLEVRISSVGSSGLVFVNNNTAFLMEFEVTSTNLRLMKRPVR